MQTKFDVGDKVFITGEIMEINIDSSGVNYVVRDDALHIVTEYAEEDLMLKQKGKRNNGE